MGGLLLNSFLLGLGLAMDAFSVSVASGLAEPDMKKENAIGIPAVFALFQFAMPLAGWVLVRTIAEKFAVFRKLIPWIALILLCFIGGKMLAEALSKNGSASAVKGLKDLLILGIATSIDALSAGLAISEYGVKDAALCALTVGLTTFAVCLAGIYAGKKIGSRISQKAAVLGGIILIAIGIEIFVKGVFLA